MNNTNGVEADKYYIGQYVSPMVGDELPMPVTHVFSTLEAGVAWLDSNPTTRATLKVQYACIHCDYPMGAMCKSCATAYGMDTTQLKDHYEKRYSDGAVLPVGGGEEEWTRS